jgi:hypothetical protein
VTAFLASVLVEQHHLAIPLPAPDLAWQLLEPESVQEAQAFQQRNPRGPVELR